MLRVTVRATDDAVPGVLLKLMQDRLSAGAPTLPDLPSPPSHRDISDAFGNVMVS
jgi:AP-2 complex subunit alpha